MTVNERWVDELLREPEHPSWRRRKAVARGRLPSGAELTVKRKPATAAERSRGTAFWYLWYVTDVGGRDRLAVGVASVREVERRRPNRRLLIGSSVVAAGARGEGLYTSVLRTLRTLFGDPIESDKDVAPAARRAWEKAGGVGAERDGVGVMRINPTGPTETEGIGMAALIDAVAYLRVPLDAHMVLQRAAELFGDDRVFFVADREGGIVTFMRPTADEAPRASLRWLGERMREAGFRLRRYGHEGAYELQVERRRR